MAIAAFGLIYQKFRTLNEMNQSVVLQLIKQEKNNELYCATLEFNGVKCLFMIMF